LLQLSVNSFVGDNLAINFINTRRMVEGQLTDTLKNDNDVKAWLRRLEVPVAIPSRARAHEPRPRWSHAVLV
jgi:hypothetical protein